MSTEIKLTKSLTKQFKLFSTLKYLLNKRCMMFSAQFNHNKLCNFVHAGLCAFHSQVCTFGYFTTNNFLSCQQNVNKRKNQLSLYLPYLFLQVCKIAITFRDKVNEFAFTGMARKQPLQIFQYNNFNKFIHHKIIKMLLTPSYHTTPMHHRLLIEYCPTQS